MKKKLHYIIFCLFLIACSGKEKMPNGDNYPSKPILIAHRGAVGDNDWLTDSNNGIDSVSEGDWIKLQWENLTDNDLKIIRIYRYAAELNQSPVKIDSVLWNSPVYIDRLTSGSIGDISRLDTDWHYFIRAVNLSNNFTDSDTVNFTLTSKPFLEFPIDGAIFENADDIVFGWRYSGDTTRLRLLLFDENKDLIWYFDEYIFINDMVYEKKYDGKIVPAGTYFWRVDSRGNPDVVGNYHSGSKSEMRKIDIFYGND